jgi:general secretion pathway protein D
VLQEVSTATAETQFGAPIINTREAETDLLVRDGQTVVLGGLINYQEETTHSGIPLLKDIPLLGMLFRSTRTQKIQTELLLMITTHVIRTEEDLDETSQRLIESTRKLKERLPDPIPLLPPLEPPPDSMPLPERTDTLPGSAN